MLKRLIVYLAIAVCSSALPVAAAQKENADPRKARLQEEQPVPIAILSIIPAQGEPDTEVTLSGAGLSAGSSAFLGSIEIPARATEERHLTFTIPDLAPGLYALFVRRPDGATSKVYTFTVLPQKPVATELVPDTIYSCASGRDREVVINGRNFRPNSQVVFDGGTIRSRALDSETIAVSIPQVNPGLHQLQVKNSEDTLSGSLGLMVDGRPEINSVAQGEGNVTYYNLNIDGRNFQQNSVLVVSEESSVEVNPSAPIMDVRRLRPGSADSRERERLTYVSCTRMIYQRVPYTTVPKSFLIQVVNPGGEESAPVSVSAP